jgi:hypothetical protein
MVEIRSLTERENTCDCADFRVNGLGTCKHVEAVLLHIRCRVPQAARQAESAGSPLVEIYLSRAGEAPAIAAALPRLVAPELRAMLAELFSVDGTLLADPAFGIPALRRAVAALPARLGRQVRISREVDEWVNDLQRRRTRAAAREAFLADVREGRRQLEPAGIKLYPYQKDGALHLAFGERALLADDMGLGKTVQAIVACDVLRQTRRIERVLVVSPVSLKAEWEEQIHKFCHRPTQVVLGPRPARLRQYRNPAFFNLVNYEQAVADFRELNEILAPDVVILDEAQRIKNWQTRTAQAVKQLVSPFAFVLTGTPLENRIDEIYSIVQYLDPHVLGPLFRFNREYYELDERGRPIGYRNLDRLHRAVRSVMLRRRKDEVEDQLPPRNVITRFVPMAPEQRKRYGEYEAPVAQLIQIAKRRPLRPEEFDRLQKYLACMRMLCDTTYILDPDLTICPKLPELLSVVESALATEGSKILVFSEWERMLDLVRTALKEEGIAFAWHTGSVPQKQRRKDINRFKEDPDCRVFLTSDAGCTGLNLQVANTVINCDLPWNPARLEQRIARAWRKHQARSVQVVNLVTENSIEERMIGTLELKQQLADGVLDGRGEISAIPLASGRGALVERITAVLGLGKAAPPAPPSGAAPAPPPADPAERFRQEIAARLADRLLLLETRTSPQGSGVLLLVVDGPAAEVASVASRLLAQSYGPSGATPALEVLDRATYDTLQRLAACGLISIAAAGGHRLHTHPSLQPSEADQARRRRATARRLVASCARDRKLAAVMAAGGFPVEALAPLSRALEAALVAAAHAASGTPTDTGPLSLEQVRDLLVVPGLLPASANDTVVRLRGVAPGITDEAAASALVPTSESLLASLVQYVEE